jgi:hypothetical protein
MTKLKKQDIQFLIAMGQLCVAYMGFTYLVSLFPF